MFVYGTSCTFDYDGNGIRNIKTAGDTTTLYVYDQGRLLYERRRTSSLTSSLYYMYDETGLIGFVYGGTQYYYRKNAQGDILSIHSANGLFATYNYDAWGNCTVTDNSGTGIGDINPFRYRGYYYDTETKLTRITTRIQTRPQKTKGLQIKLITT